MSMAMFEFDHVGITTTVPQPREDWVEASRIWVTQPASSPRAYPVLCASTRRTVQCRPPCAIIRMSPIASMTCVALR